MTGHNPSLNKVLSSPPQPTLGLKLCVIYLHSAEGYFQWSYFTPVLHQNIYQHSSIFFNKSTVELKQTEKKILYHIAHKKLSIGIKYFSTKVCFYRVGFAFYNWKDKNKQRMHQHCYWALVGSTSTERSIKTEHYYYGSLYTTKENDELKTPRVFT